MSDDLVTRLRGQHNALKSGYLKGLFLSAASTIEALRESLKVEVKSANYWMEQSFEDRARADRAEAESARLKTVGQKLLAKFDHPTACVTQWDVDELRAALGETKAEAQR